MSIIQLLTDYNKELVTNYYSKGPNRPNPYEAKLISLLEQGESFESFVIHHNTTMEVMSDLKCCGNCGYSDNCDYSLGIYQDFNYCDEWVSDEMTRKERCTI